VSPAEFQQACALSTTKALADFFEAIPDLELWLRGRALAVHGEWGPAELVELRELCADVWPVDLASVEADVAISISALSTSVLDRLGCHVRVGGSILLLDPYTMSLSQSRFDAMVAPTALEIVRCSLPHALPVFRRGRKPVACILRRRN
jgi:hypothetical protein